MASSKNNNEKEKSLEGWLWDAACALRGAQDAPKYKDFILPLVFVKRLCDVFDDEINKIAEKTGSREKALKLIYLDHKLVRFFLPIKPNNIEKENIWDVVKQLNGDSTSSLGQKLTDVMRAIAKENSRILGIVDRVDYNATTHGQRDMDDDLITRLINKISEKRLGLEDVEPDIIGRSYEYLIRKFAEGGGQSAGEFYTPMEVGFIIANILNPEPGMECYDPNCGSAGLMIKLQLVLQSKMLKSGEKKFKPLKLFGQELLPNTWAMANMNMVIHEMEGEIALGNTMTRPNMFGEKSLKKFDLVVANPMWNQKTFSSSTYENDELERFGDRIPPNSSADWGWVQHILASLNENGKAGIVLDTGAVSRGSGNAMANKEKEIRKWFVDNDLIEGVIYLPDNLFYNTTSPGILLILNKNKKKEDKEGKFFLINASKEFEKGQPKNFIPIEKQTKIAIIFNKGDEIEKFSKVITKEEIEKNDYNLSPSRYIHISDSEELRDIGEVISELRELEEEEKIVNEDLNNILNKLGY